MDEIKKQLLEAALPVFMERGFIQVTTRDLADAAGVEEEELKRHFSSTDEVFMELIKSMDNQKFDSMESYEQSSESCWEQIVKFLKLAEYQMEIVNEKSLLPALMEFNMMSWRTKKNQDFIQWRYDLGTKEMYDFFKKGVDCGEFHPTLPLETIVSFFSTQVNGLIITVQWIGEEKIQYRKQLEALKVSLTHFLGLI